jgi:ABC-2 type transport system permease protein
MTKLWVLIRNEYRTVVRTKGFAISTVLTPLFLGAMLFLPGILAMRGDTRTTTIGILEVGSDRLRPLSERMAADTLEGGEARWLIEYVPLPPADTAETIAQWTQAALDNRLDAYIVCDTSIWSGAEVSYYTTNVSRMTLFRSLRSELSDFVVAKRLEEAGLDPELTQALTSRVELSPVKIGESGRSKADFLSDYFGGLLFTMIMMMVIISYGNTLMRSVIDEKNSRIIEVLVSSVTPGQIMSGKILGLGAASMSQVVIWILMGALMGTGGFGAAYIGGAASIFSPAFAVWFVLFLILGFAFFSCLFALIGAIAPTEQDAQHFIGPITMTLIVPIVIEFAIIENPSVLWVRLLSYVPPFSPSVMLMRLTFGRIDVWEPLLSAAILAGVVIGVAWFSGRVFRIGILMTGKRPTLPEILKWVKYK